MPYRWTSPAVSVGITRLDLWPHRSLPRRGFAGFILLTAGMIAMPLFGLLGTAVLWGVLPFIVLAVGGLWFALQHSYTTARLHEALTIDADAVHLTRTEPRGDVRTWECNSYWAQVALHPTGGPVAYYITLKGKGREVEIGAFLSEDERKALYGELRAAFQRARAG